MNIDRIFWQTFSEQHTRTHDSFPISETLTSPPEEEPQPVNRRHYYLGSPYEGQYLTRREAECLLLMLRGYTNQEAAHTLTLSSRTVEYYLKNIRNKLDCYSKIHLLCQIQKTNFLDLIDFDIPPL